MFTIRYLTFWFFKLKKNTQWKCLFFSLFFEHMLENLVSRRGISESRDVYNGKPHIFILWNFSRRADLRTVSEGVWEYRLAVLWESSWPLSVYLSFRPRHSFEALSRGNRGISASVLELLDLSSSRSAHGMGSLGDLLLCCLHTQKPGFDKKSFPDGRMLIIR